MNDHITAKNYVINKNYEMALVCYKKILKPNNQQYKELGHIYEKLNMYNKAIECYLKIKNDINMLNQIAVCYINLLKYNDAIIYFTKCNSINQNSIYYYNIGTCYIKLKNYILAEQYLVNAWKLDSSNNIINGQLGNVYHILKKYDKAIFFYKKINNKEDDLIALNLSIMSLSYMAKKDFKIGFALYENRLKINNNERLDIPLLKYWDGICECNNLLIVNEQGLGDNIMYYRFIIQLSLVYPNMKITYLCHKINNILIPYNNITIVGNIDNSNISNYNYKLYIMSLPNILSLNIITPNKENYIKIDNNKLVEWKDKLKIFKKLKVGFVCNGFLNSAIEKNIPSSEFESLCDLDIDLICLHRKCDILETNNNINYFDIDEKPFEDTIHILKNIDLLITVDTSIAHLAGVMNIKTMLLLGFVSDWRWFDDNKAFWYESVEIIRMKENIELKNILKIVRDRLNFQLNFHITKTKI